MGIVKKAGAFYSYGDLRLGQGRESAKEYLSDHFDTRDEIEGQIRSVNSGTNVKVEANDEISS